MTLMKLAPEIVRLRRVAKAYAAGEFSRLEYRQARREVIENFQPDAIGDDDTQPRFAPAGGIQAPPLASAQSDGIGWAWLVAGLALALLLVLLSASAPAATIGAVSERNPNPSTSPRMDVASVQIRDFEAYPGIDRAAVDTVIESTLTEIRARNVEGNHGFTGSELDEVGRFLNALGVHQSGARLSAADAADLNEMIRGQKARRGVSVVELEEVAARVQDHYRDAGYFLTVAFVPAQEPSEDIVELVVMPGVLGDVVVNGGDADLVSARFASALGEPVTEDAIARRLYQLNQLPGLKAQAAFEPGSEPGETRLKLDVIEQRTWSARILADNHGDDATGNERLTVLASWLNPRGAGDLLNVGVLQTVDPANQTYGFAEYRTPLGGVHEIRGRVASNSFAAGDGPDMDGDGVLLDFAVQRSLRRSRSSSLTAEAGLGHHRFSWRDQEDQAATFVTAMLHGHRIWDGQRIAAGMNASVDLGRFSEGAFAGQDESFWRIGIDAYAWRPIDLPLLSGEQKLALRLSGQLSDSHLPSSRRLSLGGFARSRGFQRNTFIADKGVVVGLDLRIPIKLGELVIFADSAYGDARNELAPTWGHVSDIGVAWDADLLPNLVSRLSWALPVAAKGTGGLDDDGPKFYWQLQYAH